MLPIIAQSGSPMNFWMLGGTVAAGLLVFAAAIILHVLAAAPGQRPSLRDTFAWARGLLWSLPVLGVLALVVGRAAPRFQDIPAPQADQGDGLEIELNEPSGLTAEQPDPVDLPAEEGPAAKPESRAKKVARAVKDKIVSALPKPKDQDKVPETLPGEKPEIKSTSRLPEWISTPVSTDGDKTIIVLSSQEHPKLAQAEEEIARRAAARVKNDFEKTHPVNVEWTVPADAIRFGLVFEEKVSRETSDGTVKFTMFRMHRQLEITDETRKAAFAAWKGEIVQERLHGLGAVVGMLSLIAAGSALYLRLDARTLGQCRGRLKAATVAALTAGGLLVATLI